MAKDSVLEARFDMHEKQCVTDKSALNARLDAIDTKLWALLVFVALQLLAGVVYLTIEGRPWDEPKTVLADRGERE